MSLCSVSCVASSSRVTLSPLSTARGYATKADKLKAARSTTVKKPVTYVDPRFAPAPSDQKVDAMRNALYPVDSFNSKATSPTGAHRANLTERIEAAIGNVEIYETIERAWKLHRRHVQATRRASLEAQLKAMQAACDELDIITGGPEIPNLEAEGAEGSTLPKERKLSGKGEYPRSLYNDAMKRPDIWSTPRLQGRKITPLQRWLESRLDGMIPREAWVAVDSKGQGWNYDWKRPSATRD